MKSLFARISQAVSCSIVVLAAAAFSAGLSGQVIVDKTVATVSDGLNIELITLSDLKWQLALMPNAEVDPATSDGLNRALQLLINQRLFALEAERLPQPAPTEEEIAAKIRELLAYFPSTSEFERRLKLVGFDSVRDDNFERIIRDRVAIDKYIAFRFRAFIVITPAEEAAYYTDIFVPEFRQTFPGSIVPNFEEKRAEINLILTEQRESESIEAFLDEAKRRFEIVTISDV